MSSDSQVINVTIQSGRGTKEFAFPKQTKVSQVISEAIAAFEYAEGDDFAIVLASDPDATLDPNRPLVSYGVKDGDILILTATGSGV